MTDEFNRTGILKTDTPLTGLSPSTNLVNETAILKTAVEALNRIIGVGTHSMVYKGQLVGTSRFVTIKADNRSLLKYYEVIDHKLDTLKKLDHRYIAKLVDFIPDYENHRSYIIMQYIEGTGLNQILYDDGAQSLSRVLNWACQLLDELDYMHSLRIVHGGIDPSCIVITDGGNACFVDFRFLRYDENNAEEDSLSVSFFEECDDADSFQKGVSQDIARLGHTLFTALTGVSAQNCSHPREELLERLALPNVADVVLRAMASSAGDSTPPPGRC